MSKKNLFLFLLVIGTAFWGISFSVTKWAIGQSSYYTFLFYRFLAATVVLSLVFARYLKQTDWRSLKTGIGLGMPLVFSICLHTLGIQHTSAAQASFIAGMCVVIIPVLKLVFYHVSVPLKIWVAALVALTGLCIISIQHNYTVNVGDLYMLVGTMGFAIYLLCVEKEAAKGSLLPTIVPMFATCTLITFGMALTDGRADWLPASKVFWMGVAYCALFSTAYMYTVSSIAQRYIRAEKVAIIYLFEPVFAAIAAFFILEESLSWRLLLGGTLILVAMIITEIKFRRGLLSIKRS